MSSVYSPQYLAESKTTILNVFHAISIVLEISSTSIRLWSVRSRPSITAAFGFDDYLMIWATIVAISECISSLVYGAPYGLGEDLQSFMLVRPNFYSSGNYISSHFYNFAIVFTKLSVLALYYRIFATPGFRAIVVFTALLVFAWLITMEVVLGFECQPIQAWWGAMSGTCLDEVTSADFNNILNLVSDLGILLLPIPIILGLAAHPDQKLSICLLFSLGLGTCAINAARLTVVVSEGASDITWDEVPLGVLSAWEPCSGILSANIPVTYRALADAFSCKRLHERELLRQNSETSENQSPAENDQWLQLENNRCQ
ncbi:hypothetical protein BD289DRAFT_489014 [Coniella lustricola]|uniref:Rhodopsin domain-containing protein n=1 Tax=Coniella lustricola TaxID=2025994 RepID=A0A2T3A2X5_9PEZI|nr:hypothetical protein BD289DRAFT_489014 [Coniella lustricola]